MATLISYTTKISTVNKQWKFNCTSSFTINGETYNGVITLSSSGSDFIITQRTGSTPHFHTIQTTETSFVVPLSNTPFLPAEIKALIGNAKTFLASTRNQTNYYLTTNTTFASQSTVDLNNTQSNIYISQAGSQNFIGAVNNILGSSAINAFNFEKPSNNNFTGGGGGGTGLITLAPVSDDVEYYIPMSSVASGPISTEGTSEGLKFNPNTGTLQLPNITALTDLTIETPNKLNILPAGDTGSFGQVLTTDGAGSATWQDAGGLSLSGVSSGSYFITFSNVQSGPLNMLNTDIDLTYNASSNTIGAKSTGFAGNLSGDVIGTQSATQLVNSAVTGQQLSGFAATTGTISGNDTILSAIGKLAGNANTYQLSGNYITALSGDVFATGPGLVGATLANIIPATTVSGRTTIPNLSVDAKGRITNIGSSIAQSANIASTIVARDTNGNFSANLINANLSGNATTATVASTVTILDNDSVNGLVYPVWVSAGDSNESEYVSTNTLTFNPSIGVLSTNTFVGSLSGTSKSAEKITISSDISGVYELVMASGAGGASKDLYNFTSLTYTSNTNVINAKSTGFTGSLAGEVIGAQNATQLVNSAVIGQPLTGFTYLSGPITAADTILTAIEKLATNTFISGTNLDMVYNLSGLLETTQFMSVGVSGINSADIIPKSTNTIGISGTPWYNAFLTNINLGQTNLTQYQLGVLQYEGPVQVQSIVKDINIVYVRAANAGPDEFLSVSAALAGSICAAASTANPITVQVSPGVYYEDVSIIMKSYVSLVGTPEGSTEIVMNSPGFHLITMADNSSICNLHLTGYSGSNPNRAAVYYSGSSGADCAVHDITFGANDTYILCEATTVNCSMSATDLKFAGIVNTGVYATSTGIGGAIINILNSTTVVDFPDAAITLFKVDQPNCRIGLNSVNLVKGALTANGTAIHCQNGGSVNLLSVYIRNWATGIYVPSNGSAATVNAVGMNFVNNGLNVNIVAANATGKIDGINNNNTQTYINQSNSLYIINKDTRIITVAKKGGDYSTVSSAMAAVSLLSPGINNMFLITVGPGVFMETPITIQPYTVIQGASYLSVLYCSQQNINFITGAPNAAIINCVIVGATDSGYAIYHNNAGLSSTQQAFALSNVRFGTNSNLIHVDGTIYPSVITCFNTTFGGMGSFNNGILVESISSYPSSAQLTLRSDSSVSNTITSSLIVQNLLFVATSSGYSLVNIQFVANATFSIQVIGYSIIIKFVSGITTAAHILAAFSSFPAAAALVSVYPANIITNLIVAQNPAQLYLPDNFINVKGPNSTVLIDSMNCPTGGQADIYSAHIQGLTYTANDIATGSTTSITYIGGGTAGSEIVSVLGNAITIQIQNGASTSLQIQTAILMSLPASNLVSVDVSVIAANYTQGILTLQKNCAGDFARLENGANVNCTGSTIQGWNNAFYIENIGPNYSNLIVNGTNISNCNLFVNVEQPYSTGNYTGYIPFDRKFIISSSLFFVSGKDARNITVFKTGGDFNSVNDALASITDNSLTNRYTILVGPGLFIEQQITLKQYVNIIGNGASSTILQAADPNDHFIIGVKNSMLKNCVLTMPSIVSDNALIYYNTPDGTLTNTMGITDCTLGTADIIILVENSSLTTAYSNIIVMNCGYGNVFNFNYGFKCVSTNSGHCNMELMSLTTVGGINTAPIATIVADGAFSVIKVLNHLSDTGQSSAAGTFAQCVNGGAIELNGVAIEKYAIAVDAPADASSPSFIITGSDFNNCSLDLNINNINCYGYIIGYVPPAKRNINNTCTFFIANTQRRIVTVARKGADFTTIQDAVAYVAAQVPPCAEDNPFIINVGPGVYDEVVPIDLTSPNLAFLTIMGNNIGTTIIRPTSTDDIFLTGTSTSIYSMQFVGNGFMDYGTGKAAIKCVDGGGTSVEGFLINKCQFKDIDIGIWQESNTSTTYGYTEICDFNGSFSYGVYVKCTNLAINAFNSNDILYVLPTDSVNPCIGVYGTGIGTYITVSSGAIEGPDPVAPLSCGVCIEDGADLELTSCPISYFDIAINNSDGAGAASSINALACHLESNNTDINIQNLGTVGCFNGQATFTKINRIVGNTTFSWNFTDIETGANESTNTLNITFPQGTHTEIIELISNQGVGLISGGTLSGVSALNVNVSQLIGYYINSSSELAKADLSGASLSLTDNADNWIYVDTNGIISSSLTQPTLANDILLGRAQTLSGSLLFIDETKSLLTNESTIYGNIAFKIFGALFSVPIVIQADGPLLPLQLNNISNGQYYVGSNLFNPSPGNNITFDSFYYPSGWIVINNQQNVDVLQYDNDSGSLVAITVNYYAKHSLYIIGEGVNQKYFLVYSQAEYATLNDANNAPIPTPPPYFSFGVVPIAAIIVSPGATPPGTADIISILSICPVPLTQASAPAAVSNHLLLSNLTFGDAGHNQFLMLNGSKAMTGNLDMGSYAINPGTGLSGTLTVDNVIVAAHKNRHLPGGFDPLPVGVARTIGYTNQTTFGNAASFSQSDHVHAHGDLSGGTLHALATAAAAGFMSAADKTKLDGISGTAVGNNTGDQIITLSGSLSGIGVNVAGPGISGYGYTYINATVITNANLTGPVTSIGNATSIGNNAITNAMLANTALSGVTGINTGDQLVSLTGAITGSGTGTLTNITTNFNNTALLGQTLSGFVATTGTMSATSTILQGFQILTGNMSGLQPAGNYITQLSGDVLASGPGFATATLKLTGPGALTVSGLTTIPNITIDNKGRITALSGNTAQSANVVSTVVARDVNGSFAANIITASLSGNAASASTAAITDNNSNVSNVFLTWSALSGNNTNIAISESSTKLQFNPATSTVMAATFSGTATAVNLSVDSTTNAQFYIPFSASNAGSNILNSAALTYNPNTNIITAAKFQGNLSGFATGVNVLNASGVGSYNLAMVPSTGNTNLYLNNPLIYNSANNSIGANISGTSINSNNTAIVDNNTLNVEIFPAWITLSGNNYDTVKISSEKITFNPSLAVLKTATFAGALSGTAYNATRVDVVETVDNAVYHPMLAGALNGVEQVINDASGLTYNPATGVLSAPILVGTLSGASTGVKTSEVVNGQYYLAMISGISGNQSVFDSSGIYANASGVLFAAVHAGSLSGSAYNTSGVSSQQITNGLYYPVMVPALTGSAQLLSDHSGFSFNATTGVLTVPTIIGTISGAANTVKTTEAIPTSGNYYLTAVVNISGAQTLFDVANITINASGVVAAPIFDGDLTGNATSATSAASVDVYTASGGQFFLPMVALAGLGQTVYNSTQITATASGVITAPKFVGTLSGSAYNASGISVMPFDSGIYYPLMVSDLCGSALQVKDYSGFTVNAGTNTLTIGTVVASLSGNANSASRVATSVAVPTSGVYYPTFVAATSGPAQTLFDVANISINASGAIIAPTFVGSLSGNAVSASAASAIATIELSGRPGVFYPTFVDTLSGTTQIVYDSSGIYVNSSGVLTATIHAGNLSGSAYNASGVSVASATTGLFYPTMVSAFDGSAQAMRDYSGFTINTANNTLTIGTVIASLSGNATSATTAISANTSNAIATIELSGRPGVFYPTFVSTISGTSQIVYDSSGIYVNSSGVLNASVFVGSLSGNANSSTNANNALAISTTELSGRPGVFYPTFVSAITGASQTVYDSSGIYVNSSGVLTATVHAGNLSGSAYNASGVSVASAIIGIFYPTMVSSFDGSAQAMRDYSGFTINTTTNTLTIGTVVASLSGNATSATTATNANNASAITTTELSGRPGVFYPTFVSSITGSSQTVYDSSGIFVNSSGVINASIFVGSLSGNANSATTANSATNANNASAITTSIAAPTSGVYYPTFVAATSGTGQTLFDIANISINASGAIIAPTFVGSLSGIATSATIATNANNASAIATIELSGRPGVFYPTFVSAIAGASQTVYDSSGIYVNSSGVIFASVFAGSLSGSVSSAAGIDITSTVGSGTYYLTFASGQTGTQTLYDNSGITVNPATRGIITNRIGTGGLISDVNSIAIGNLALSGMTGSGNTALGVGAGSTITTGSNNLLLGVNTGNLLTTGDNNIMIGNTGVAGDTNVVRIGTTTQTACFIAQPFLRRFVVTSNAGGGNITILPSELLGGIIIKTAGIARTWTLPTGTSMSAAITNVAIGDSFSFSIISAAGTITMAAGTGFTLFVASSIAAAARATFTAVNTAANTWVLY
jgi:hypothetical protein